MQRLMFDLRYQFVLFVIVLLLLSATIPHVCAQHYQQPALPSALAPAVASASGSADLHLLPHVSSHSPLPPQQRWAQRSWASERPRTVNPYIVSSHITSPHEVSPHEAGLREELLPPPDFQQAMNRQVLPPPDAFQFADIDDTLGPSIRIFEPKARVYFDTGWEAADKLDIFHDGSLTPAINFLELYWARPWPGETGRPDWRWGPSFGIGISSRAGDSSDGSAQASGAPVLLLSYGLQFEFPLNSRQFDAMKRDPNYGPAAANKLRHFAPKAGIEFGYALGFSSDESLDYSADGAIYVGVSLHVLP